MPPDTAPDSSTPAPRDFDPWLIAAGVGVMVVGVGTVVVLARRMSAGMGLFGEDRKLDVPALNPPSPLEQAIRALHDSRLPRSPGLDVLYRALTQGLRDDELQRKSGPRERSSLYFHKAFGDARVLGIQPTELAVSGRYFGEDVLPVRIEIQHDGRTRLVDGRQRYDAAKQARASAILANVVLYGPDGDIVFERLAPVGLI